MTTTSKQALNTRNRLVTDNLALIDHVLNRLLNLRTYWPVGCREDAYQIGCLGLLHAAARFDATRGTRFSTFAVKTIRGFLLTGLNRGGLIKSNLSKSKHKPRTREQALQSRNLVSLHVLTDDFVPRAPDVVEDSDRKERVREVLACLNPQERRIVWGRYAEGMTLRELARELGKSNARVWQILERAKQRLREHSQGAFAG